MFGKVFCLYLLLLLVVIIVNFYSCLSGMNATSVNIWREIHLGFFCLVFSATLFHFCNYAHNFANSVRYKKILFELTYMVIFMVARCILSFTDLLHTNKCTIVYYISLKFTLKCLKCSYMIRSLDHPQGAYIFPC